MRKLSDTKQRLLSMSQFIVAGYNAGATLRELATLYETSTGSIRSLLIEEGVEMRKVGRRHKENN